MQSPAQRLWREAGRGGGREKAPAAICRKVIEAKISGRHDIEIWGAGEQTRRGTQLVVDAAFADPLNLGSDRLVSINTLVDIVETIAGVKLRRTYKFDAPTEVRGRNSDNTLIGQVLGSAPSIPLEEGLEKTYR